MDAKSTTGLQAARVFFAGPRRAYAEARIVLWGVVPVASPVDNIRAFDEQGLLIGEVPNVWGDETEQSPFVGFARSKRIARIEVDHKDIGGVSIDDVWLDHFVLQ